jgi:hypothetical protein
MSKGPFAQFFVGKYEQTKISSICPTYEELIDKNSVSLE